MIHGSAITKNPYYNPKPGPRFAPTDDFQGSFSRWMNEKVSMPRPNCWVFAAPVIVRTFHAMIPWISFCGSGAFPESSYLSRFPLEFLWLWNISLSKVWENGIKSVFPEFSMDDLSQLNLTDLPIQSPRLENHWPAIAASFLQEDWAWQGSDPCHNIVTRSIDRLTKTSWIVAVTQPRMLRKLRPVSSADG